MIEEILNIVRQIVLLIIIPLTLYIIKSIVSDWRKLNLKKKELKLKEQLKKESTLNKEKETILFAWQNSINNVIRKREYIIEGESKQQINKDVETNTNEKIQLFLSPKIANVDDGKEVYFLYPLGELISQTIVYSFDKNVHKLVKELLENSYEKLYSESVRDEDLMVYNALIYYYLVKEWQGFKDKDIEIDYLLKIYLRDYSLNPNDTESINYMKQKIKEINDSLNRKFRILNNKF